MNKFKAWLIRKLGGCVYLDQSQRIVFKELPCITVNVDIVLPSSEWDRVISENEKIKIANREAAEKIGYYIVDNGLCEIIRNYDVEFNREKVRYKIKVVQPPNAPQLSNEYGNIGEEPNNDLYVNRFDNPESFYPRSAVDYSNWRQGKDGF